MAELNLGDAFTPSDGTQGAAQAAATETVVDEKETPSETPAEEKPVQMYKYLDQMILNAVKKITDFSLDEAAATMKEAYSKKQIGATLTVEEAELFARNLIAPK